MKRRNFPSMLGLAPLAAKLGWAKTSPMTPPLALKKEAFETVAKDLPLDYRAGDWVVYPKVFSVNPVTRQSTGHLLIFTVVSVQNGIPLLQPSAIANGQYQNVTQLPEGMPVFYR